MGLAPRLLGPGDDLAQLEQAQIGGVTGFAPLQGEDGCFADMPGSDEVRLAHAERDDVLHSLDDFKKITDARARDVAHVAGDALDRVAIGEHLIVGDDHERFDAEVLQIDAVLERAEIVPDVQRSGGPVAGENSVARRVLRQIEA